MLHNQSLEPIFLLSPSLYYMHRVTPKLRLDLGTVRNELEV
jgi:hypothetical protein